MKRTGFYFGVAKEGRIQAGDELVLLDKNPAGLAVADVTRLYTTEMTNIALLKKAISSSSLPESLRVHFENQLAKLGH